MPQFPLSDGPGQVIRRDNLPLEVQALLQQLLGSEAPGDELDFGQYLTKPAADATYVQSKKIDQRAYPVGRRAGWGGDSITNGSASTNASTASFRGVVPRILGSARVRPFTESINGGVAGDRSDQLLARLDSILAAGAEFLVVMVGTNDASQGVTLAVYQANIKAIVAKAQAAGVPILLCTVPPRASSVAAATHTLLRSYNLWLRLWAPAAGIPLVATHAALVDQATGYLAAAYDSGDGTHPNDAGHLALAQAMAPAIAALLREYPWPAASGPLAGFGMVANPLVSSTTGWTAIAGSPTSVAAAAPVTGDALPAGQWLSIAIDNSAGGSNLSATRGATLDASGWSVGDQLLVCFWAKYVGGQTIKASLYNQSNAVLANPMDGLRGPAGVGVPFLSVFTVPAGTTTLKLVLASTALAGTSVVHSIGAADVFNLTRAGLSEFAA